VHARVVEKSDANETQQAGRDIWCPPTYLLEVVLVLVVVMMVVLLACRAEASSLVVVVVQVHRLLL
jgi:hypothetical protein